MSLQVGHEISVRLPEEPPIMSIVIDDTGMAWQRVAIELWSATGHHRDNIQPTGKTWHELCVSYKYLQVIQVGKLFFNYGAKRWEHVT